MINLRHFINKNISTCNIVYFQRQVDVVLTLNFRLI